MALLHGNESCDIPYSIGMIHEYWNEVRTTSGVLDLQYRTLAVLEWDVQYTIY